MAGIAQLLQSAWKCSSHRAMLRKDCKKRIFLNVGGRWAEMGMTG